MPVCRGIGNLLCLAFFASVFIFLWAWIPEEPIPSKDEPGPVGVWRMTTEEYGQNSFRYDGCYVIKFMWTRWDWQWHPQDYCWRLESKWDGDDLYVRYSHDGWSRMTTFTNGCFQLDDGSCYRKVSQDELKDRERVLLRARPPYDYSLTTIERGKPSPLRMLLPALWRL